MQKARQAALQEVRNALERLVASDESLATHIAEALDRAARMSETASAGSIATPDPEALGRLGRDLALFGRCLPVSHDGSFLTVVAAEPLDSTIVGLLEAEAGPIRATVTSATAVWEALRCYYPVETASGSAAGSSSQDRDPVDAVVESGTNNEPSSIQETPDQSPSTILAAPSFPPGEAPLILAAPEPEETASSAILAAPSDPSNEPTIPAPDAESPIGTADLAALFTNAEANAKPVEAEKPPSASATDEQFAELLAEVEGEAAESLTSGPREQNFDLLEEFAGLEASLPLSEPPSSTPEAESLAGDGLVPEPAEPTAASAQLRLVDRLLDEPIENGVSPDLVPMDIAIAALCAPTAVEGGDLVCLIADPPDMEGASAVSEAADMPLRLRVTTKEHVLEALHALYGEFDEATPSGTAKGRKASLVGKLLGRFKRAA